MKILFVCMGNICRSPMAEGYFRHLLATRAAHLDITTDSAGTHHYHAGSPPDPRAQEAALRRGMDISKLAARNVVAADFDRFDYVVAMDQENVANLLELADPAQHDKVHLFMDFSSSHTGEDVPDPYYGGRTGFERVLDLIEKAADGLLEEVERVAMKKA